MANHLSVAVLRYRCSSNCSAMMSVVVPTPAPIGELTGAKLVAERERIDDHLGPGVRSHVDVDMEFLETETTGVVAGEKAKAIEFWNSKPRLYGSGPGTRGIASNLVTNVVKSHEATSLFYEYALLQYGKNKRTQEENEKIGGRLLINIFSVCMSLCIGLFWFSAFGAIRLYMTLDCGAGCDVFIWPDASDLIQSDARFDPTMWDSGTEMCTPVPGSYSEATCKECGTQDFKLGPAYPKPFPTQHCDESKSFCDDGSRDPLYTWGVSVDVINGVIFGAEDHHCFKDQCYYIQKAVYDKHLCNEEVFDTYEFNWWWAFIVSNLLQFGFQLYTNFLSSDDCQMYNNGNPECNLTNLTKYVLVIPFGCSVFLVGFSVFFIVIAAAASPIFAKSLFEPFFAAIVLGWLAGAIVPPAVSMPKFLWHRAMFQEMFPGARNLEDFSTNPALKPGSTVEKMERYEQGYHAKIIYWSSVAWEWLTRLEVISPPPFTPAVLRDQFGEYTERI